ncbi:hypothetical protein PV05_00518 [Exophiala xenobiotica]|uniref:Uncharacterized protein n=1 Tax=Exophiala xenobiotica TaxID=348802 RepID=A0A0D2EX20_9EURO|nr:uncharacterized protein PV05_00518 [Exophiala xenobiotica]KIW60288.1 hypothetical protein PV05_00518 [Exophiala xenobiotica]
MILAADDDPHAHAHVGYLGKVKLSVQSTFHRINDREWYCVVEDDSLPPLTLNKSMQPKKSTEPESEALPIGMQVSKKKKREKAEARKRAKERDRKETELEEEDENQKRKEAREELKREAQGTSQRSAGQK